MACVGFGPCTVSIFPCPATATLAGQAIFFRIFLVLTLTLVYNQSYRCLNNMLFDRSLHRTTAGSTGRPSMIYLIV